MSISFSCECGKKLAAKDNFAGRRLKCPGCGRSLTIPQRRAVATQLAGAGASASRGKGATAVRTSPGFVHFACDDCGRKMRARLADVGKDIDCPRCGVEMAIPLTDGAAPITANGGPPIKAAPKPPPVTRRIEPMPPLPARAPLAPATTRAVPAPAPITAKGVPLADPHTSIPAPAPLTARAPAFPIRNDSLVAQHLTPWRDDEVRRQAGKPPPEPKVVRARWLLPLAALVVLVLLAVQWYLVQEGQAHVVPSTDHSVGPLALIPTKAVKVTTFRVAGNDKSLSADTKTALDRLFQEKNFNWSLKDLEHYTVMLMESDPFNAPKPPPNPVAAGGGKKAPAPAKPPTTDEIVIVQTRQPYIEHDVLLRVLQNGANYYRQPVNKRSYWRPHVWSPDRAVYFIDPYSFAFGEIASIDHFVREQSVHGIPSALETTGEAALQHDLVVGINFSELTPLPSKGAIPPLNAFRTAVVTKDDPRDGRTKPKWVLRMTYAKSNVAELAKESLDKFKIPPEAVEVHGPTLQVTLEASGSDPHLEALLGSVVGLVQRTSTLRQREAPVRPPPLGPPK